MPSVTATPAQLVITGGAAATIPARFSATGARLVITGGTAVLGPGTGADLSVTTPELNRAQRQVPIGEVRGGMVYLTAQEQLRQQRMLEAIEAAFVALTTQVGDNTALLSQIQIASNLAQAANDNATTTTAAVSLAGSFINPVGVLTASNDGSITIAAHTRIYGGGTSVSVDGGSVSGFAPGNYVSVYYADAARVGGAVTYLGTTNAVSQSGNIHVVGQVAIPAVGETSTSGTGPTAPGYTPPDPFEYDPRLIEYSPEVGI